MVKQTFQISNYFVQNFYQAAINKNTFWCIFYLHLKNENFVKIILFFYFPATLKTAALQILNGKYVMEFEFAKKDPASSFAKHLFASVQFYIYADDIISAL